MNHKCNPSKKASIIKWSKLTASVFLCGVFLSKATGESTVTENETYSEDTILSLADDYHYNGASLLCSKKLEISGAEKDLRFSTNNKQNLITGSGIYLHDLSLLKFENVNSERPVRAESGDLIFQQIGSVIADGNVLDKETRFFTRESKDPGTVLFSDIDYWSFSHNQTTGDTIPGIFSGLMVCVTGGNSPLTFEKIGQMEVIGNVSIHGFAGGIIAMENGSGSLQFLNNYRQDQTGSYSGGLLFKDNLLHDQIGFNAMALGLHGGVIFSVNDISFMNNADVQFLDNGIKTGATQENSIGCYGAAICTHGDGVQTFSADKGNLVFKGNYTIHDTYKVLDSLYIRSNTKVLFRAQQGREISFYDSIHINDDDSSQGVWLNAPETDMAVLNDVYGETTSPEYDGIIRFSGTYLDDYIQKDAEISDETEESYQSRRWSSRYSHIGADLYFEKGELIVENEAVIGYQANEWDAQKTTADNIAQIKEGTVELTFEKETSTTLSGKIIQLSGEGMITSSQITATHADLVWKTDGSGHLLADRVSLDKGLAYDFTYAFEAARTRNPDLFQPTTGMTITANHLTLDGQFTIVDTKLLYADPFWKEDRSFLVIDDTKGTRTGDFSDIISDTAGSSQIESPYVYQGTWSLSWEGDSLYAHWKNTNPIEEPEPEMMGSITENTLWVSANNLKALSRVSHGQINSRVIDHDRCANMWAAALGDYMNQGNQGATDGFDYNGSGYAVGIDSALCPKNYVGGISMGQLAGTNKTRRYSSTVDQNSLMMQLYGGYQTRINEKLDYQISATGGYGRTQNKMKSFFSEGGVTFADWNNDSWMIDVASTWNYSLSETWTLSPFLGLEYNYSSHDQFTEWGDAARVREFGKADMSYLRMPVGFGFSHVSRINPSSAWINSLRLSYLPDVYRNDPQSEAVWSLNGTSWEVRSASPERHAGRVEANSFYKLDAVWGIFAAYSLEVRKNSTYQQAHLGFSANF